MIINRSQLNKKVIKNRMYYKKCEGCGFILNYGPSWMGVYSGVGMGVISGRVFLAQFSSCAGAIIYVVQISRYIIKEVTICANIDVKT